MKNYLLFIIDSLNYSHLKDSEIELMPTLRKLEEEGISCERMYSEAPYTEAAVMNIYCGEDVLNNGGYLFRFKKAPLTIFEAMKEKGFETYYNSYQPQCHPSSVRRGIDKLYYNVGYDEEALWAYRMAHYSSVYKNGALNQQDEEDLKELFSDNFNEWIRFTEDLLKKDESTELIYSNASNYDAEKIKKEVEEQKAQFDKDSKAYIVDVLTKGRSHPFFAIGAYSQDVKIKNRAFIKEAQKELKPLFSRIRRMNFERNVKNATGKICKAPFSSFGKFLKHPSGTTAKDFAKSGLGALNSFFDLDLTAKRKDNYDSFKNAPSARTHIDHYLEYARNQKGKKPHFAIVHVDDVHNPEEFFTYDSEDLSLLKEEIAEANRVLDELPKDYYGNVTHDLSLRYIDGVIKYLFAELEKSGLKEDTCVLICADHGFSFSGNPIRDSYVVNLYLENYNIPFVIAGSGLPHKRITDFRESKDIPSTICDLADGKVPEAFKGKSVLCEEGYPIDEIEYCGGGCPDLQRRELKMAAFDESYFVGTLGTLERNIGDIITEVYDLSKDPLQLDNLAKKGYNEEKAGKLIAFIEERRRSIGKQVSMKEAFSE